MDDAQNIEVEIGLRDGRTFEGVLPSNSPILQSLFAGLMASQHPDPNLPVTLIQFPIEDGDAACSFMSDALISVVTKPPVLINPVHQALPGVAAVPAMTPLPYVQIDDFLTPEENAQVLAYAQENESDFTGSTVLDSEGRDVDDGHRKSRVLFTIQSSPWFKLFEQRLKLHMVHVGPTLGLDGDKLKLNEFQLTASNDGDFFKAHADSSDSNETVAKRVLTFVYYFHTTPKPYVGGDLLIYDGPHGQTRTSALPTRNNSLVLFPSALMHEVDLVRCPTGAFSDSRFTINGWYNQQA